MTFVKDTISSLIGGVSQQPDKLCYPSQIKQGDNAYLSMNGLKKRPPTEHIANLIATPLTNACIHWFKANDGVEYCLVLTGTDIKVFDLLGVEYTVTKTAALSYITNANPRDNLVCVTGQNTTYITNKTVIAEMKNTPSYNRGGHEALIFVRQGDYSTSYNISINGALAAAKTTSATDAHDIQTDVIALDLHTALSGALDSSFTLTTTQSVIYIYCTVDFTVDAYDSVGNTNIYVFKGAAETLTDLPMVAPDGFQMKIYANPSEESDDTYVSFVTTDQVGIFGRGYWKEDIKPSILYIVNELTMPHTLVRNNNGTFTYDVGTWDNRLVGDDTSNIVPSFIGQKITNCFFHRNRFGIISEDDIIYSSSKDNKQFFRTTVQALLDIDPIDMTLKHSKAALIRFALEFDETLLLSTDQAQFMIGSYDYWKTTTPLTPKLTTIDYASSYSLYNKVQPVHSEDTFFFCFPKNDWLGVREYRIDRAADTKKAIELTNEIPAFIPTNVFKASVSTTANLLALLSSDTPYTLYMYHYYYNKTEKIQSAWTKWIFNSDATILSVEFTDNLLYLVVSYSDGVYLETIDLTELKEDSVGFLVHVDRKTTDVTMSYSSSTKLTTITLPYVTTGTVVCVDENGLDLNITTQGINNSNKTYVTIKGDKSSEDIIAGIQYTLTVEIPTIYYYNKAESPPKIGEGRLTLKSITFNYVDTGGFDVEITRLYNGSSTNSFTGRIVGTALTQLNTIPISSGSFITMIAGKNNETTIKLINSSHVPSQILSYSWEGDYVTRGRQI